MLGEQGLARATCSSTLCQAVTDLESMALTQYLLLQLYILDWRPYPPIESVNTKDFLKETSGLRCQINKIPTLTRISDIKGSVSLLYTFVSFLILSSSTEPL